MGKNKVATAKHMHCQVKYSTRGGSHIQLHRPILDGAALLCSPFVVCLGIRYNSGYRDPGKLRDERGFGSTQRNLKSCQYNNLVSFQSSFPAICSSGSNQNLDYSVGVKHNGVSSIQVYNVTVNTTGTEYC